MQKRGWILFLLFAGAGCARSDVELKACGQSERITLPDGWKVGFVQESFSSAATELEKNLPTGQKAKVSFSKGSGSRAVMYVTAVLWTPDEIERYREHLKNRIHYSMQLPYYVGQSKKFRFMHLQSTNAEELIERLRSL